MKKVIVVSGGLGGLAQSLVKHAPEDYRFVLVDIKDDIPEDMSGLGNFDVIKVDATDGIRLESLLHTYFNNEHCTVSGIVNTTAWHDFKKLEDTTYENIKGAIESKLLVYINTIKACLKYLDHDASIINIASVHAHATKDGFSAYAAANGGVISLTKALAVELRKKARVNTVTPGGFLTDEHKAVDGDWEEKMKNRQVLKVEEVTEVILFLLSDKSSGVNGAEILTEVGTSALRANSGDW